MRTLELAGVEKVSSGKVREMFAVGHDRLLMVATDRISAFDVILPRTIPHKGRILNQISAFWFARTTHIVKNHLISTEASEFPPPLPEFASELAGRSSLVKRCDPLPIECVVRGYLAGSGWKDYQKGGKVCGIELPANLRESDRLSRPIFTPATKETSGHDVNVSFEEASEILGRDLAEEVRRISLDLYIWARDYALERGIIICDTKFEFGRIGSDLYLIDEVLTPDSSRFWPADKYTPGVSQPSFDKQYMRDYLETLDWDKTPPGPELPDGVVEATSERYIQAYRLLTGREPDLGE